MRILNRAPYALLLLVLLPLAGCSQTGPHLEPVEGRVTLGGGNWPTGGTLTFAPVEAEKGLPQVPGWGNFGSDGRFTAICASGSGLVPGKYVVNVVCSGEGEGHDGKPVRSQVAPSYQAKPHQVTIERNRQGELVLDIPKG